MREGVVQCEQRKIEGVHGVTARVWVKASCHGMESSGRDARDDGRRCCVSGSGSWSCARRMEARIGTGILKANVETRAIERVQRRGQGLARIERRNTGYLLLREHPVHWHSLCHCDNDSLLCHDHFLDYGLCHSSFPPPRAPVKPRTPIAFLQCAHIAHHIHFCHNPRPPASQKTC